MSTSHRPICWNPLCGQDVPPAGAPGPFCSQACRDSYWGGEPEAPEELVACRACEVPAETCRGGWNIVHRRCCSNCDHGAGPGWRAGASYVAGIDAALREGFSIDQARQLNGGPEL